MDISHVLMLYNWLSIQTLRAFPKLALIFINQSFEYDHTTCCRQNTHKQVPILHSSCRILDTSFFVPAVSVYLKEDWLSKTRNILIAPSGHVTFQQTHEKHMIARISTWGSVGKFPSQNPLPFISELMMARVKKSVPASNDVTIPNSHKIHEIFFYLQ